MLHICISIYIPTLHTHTYTHTRIRIYILTADTESLGPVWLPHVLQPHCRLHCLVLTKEDTTAVLGRTCPLHQPVRMGDSAGFPAEREYHPKQRRKKILGVHCVFSAPRTVHGAGSCQSFYFGPGSRLRTHSLAAFSQNYFVNAKPKVRESLWEQLVPEPKGKGNRGSPSLLPISAAHILLYCLLHSPGCSY